MIEDSKKNITVSRINKFQSICIRIVSKLIGTKRQKVNYFKSLYVNFCFFPFKDAIKMPILIYGECTLYAKGGQIKFTVPIHRGVLKIGLTDPVRSYYSKSFLSINGDLVVGNNVILRRGINLEIIKNAVLELEDNVSIGHNCTLIVYKNICIKRATSVGNNTTFMDTDFHYIVNMQSKTVKSFRGNIEINENCWIGGNCIIKKNTILPRGTILAGPFSMVSKDYTKIVPEFSIIAGCPAKLVVENMRRINNDDTTSMLYEYFSHTSEPYKFDEKTDMEKICMPM